jgi:hypothetical protein
VSLLMPRSPRTPRKSVAAAFLRVVVLSASLLARGAPTWADIVPAPVKAELPDARLSGEGVMRWLGLKVYTAQLWTGAAGVRNDQPTSQPLALELRYATGLKGEAIAERSLQEIEKLGYGDAPRRSRWLSELKRLMPNIAADDRLTGILEPKRGVAFFHNDKPIGRIDDAEFASAFFSIWLDERTTPPALRASLLRGAGGASGSGR